MKVLSHGGGVQTRALLRLCLNGEWERPDHVVFADTQAEPEEVYRAVQEDKEACEADGIPFHIVTRGDLSATDKWGGLSIPAFTLNGNGNGGMLRRQCTNRFKVAPIRTLLRSLGATAATPVELWLGISTDEASRCKPSNVKYATHRWPLIEMGWSRDNCLDYLTAHGITPTKSACVFCPYHNASEWRRIRANPRDWEAAVAYDQAIRKTRPAGGDVFVHSARVPLDEAPIENDALQPDLWGNECGGYCGL